MGKRLEGKDDNPCLRCKAICCRYVALPIDTPETKGDFDDIRWYIAHRGVWVFVEDGDWYICFQSKCRYLDGDNKCTIYDRRPRICRGYKTNNCEFTGEGEAYDMKFKKPEDIEEYAKEYLKKKRNRLRKKKR